MRIPSLYGNVRIVDLLVHSPRSNAVRILGATQVCGVTAAHATLQLLKDLLGVLQTSPIGRTGLLGADQANQGAPLKPISQQRAGRKHARSVAIQRNGMCAQS